MNFPGQEFQKLKHYRQTERNRQTDTCYCKHYYAAVAGSN